MNNPPAEFVEISPETLEVANAYLRDEDINIVAQELGITADKVSTILARKEVKTYINQVFFDSGYNNRIQMRRAMDAVIKRKFQDMEEADVGSSKDIIDILQISHKMSMDHLDKEIQLEKLKSANMRNQTNIQINNGANYNTLLDKLISGTK